MDEPADGVDVIAVESAARTAIRVTRRAELDQGEARLVAKLEHPHIVSLYDFWRDPAELASRFETGAGLAATADVAGHEPRGLALKEGEERRTWWEWAVAAFLPCAEYLEWAPREIPRFVAKSVRSEKRRPVLQFRMISATRARPSGVGR